MKTGIELIAQERKEQIEKHGFDVSEDAQFYEQQELRRAAMYALTLDDLTHYPSTWDHWFANKMMDKRRRMSSNEFDIERLKIAGALIAAEIDRLNESLKQ